MFLLYSLLILIFPVVISVNVLMYISVVKKAIRKDIEPELKEKGLYYIEYKWPGLFSNGDFKEDNLPLKFMSKNGKASNSFYAYIYYKAGSKTKRTTVRIDTIFWSIDKIAYSSEF
jgi:hypothetical protein